MTAIYKYRKKQNMTQAQLAEILGVAPSTITQYENGTRKPNIVMLKRIAKVLHTSTDNLLAPIVI